MDTLQIKQLLDKYFAAETTKDEEYMLATYFNQPEIDSELLPYAAIFKQFGNEKQLKAPQNANNRLREIQQQSERKNRRRLQYISLSLVAGLLMLITVSIFQDKNKAEDNVFIMYSNGQRIDDPVAAMEFTNQQLGILYNTFSGTGELIAKPINTINQSLTPLKTTQQEMKKIEQIFNFKHE